MTFALVETVNLATQTNSITFSAIPNDATDLMLEVSGRTTGGTYIGNIRFNTDSGSNYNFYNVNAFSSTPGRGAQDSGTSGLFVINDVNATSNFFGLSKIYIYNYASSNGKEFTSIGIRSSRDSSRYLLKGQGFWSGTAQINTITLTPSSGDFTSGTTVSLYKIVKAA